MKTKNELIQETTHDFDSLLSIMSILRSPEGCPWDREQTHHSVRKCLIEETYEVVEAIDSENDVLLREELGDLLFQVIFHAQIEAEKGSFDINCIINDVCAKMIYRHPHVFADVNAETPEQVTANWDALKKMEKQYDTVAQSLENVPPLLPGLLKAQKLAGKAKRKLGFGFDTKEDALSYAKRDDISYADAVFAICAAAEFDGVDMEKEIKNTCNSFVAACKEYEICQKVGEIY